MSVVYTGGTFDLMHVGHLELLKGCREIAGVYGKVVVALNTDEFVQQFKAKTVVCSYKQRREVLESTRYVDLVVCNTGCQDSKPSIEVVQPDAIVIGADWEKTAYMTQMGFTDEWLEERGIELIFLERTTGVSTSGLRTRAKTL